MFFAQRELAVNPPADVILEPPNCRARWLGHFFLFYLFIFFVMLEPPSCRARWLGHFIYLFIYFFLGGGGSCSNAGDLINQQSIYFFHCLFFIGVVYNDIEQVN